MAGRLLLGFYFLLCSGEYAYMQNPDTFCVRDIHLLIRDHHIHPYTARNMELNQVNFVTLEFTNQKNGYEEK
jgi:hypothetical protein